MVWSSGGLAGYKDLTSHLRVSLLIKHLHAFLFETEVGVNDEPAGLEP